MALLGDSSELYQLRPVYNCELRVVGELNLGNQGGKELHRYGTGTLRVAPLFGRGLDLKPSWPSKRGELFRVGDSLPST